MVVVREGARCATVALMRTKRSCDAKLNLLRVVLMQFSRVYVCMSVCVLECIEEERKFYGKTKCKIQR